MGKLYMPILSFLFLTSALPTIFASSSPGNQCLSAFNNPQYRDRFDVCRTKPCIVFRREPPFIFLDPTMTSEADQRPFLCADFQKQYSGALKGAFFDIVREMRALEGAYCVWAGVKESCSFNGLLHFLDDSAIAGDEHQWIAGGLLFILESRITKNTIPSTPLIADQFQVIGPPVEVYTTASQAAATIVRPFTPKAWGFILAAFIGHALLRAYMVADYVDAVSYPRGFDWKLFRERFFSVRNDHRENNGNQYEEEVLRNRNAFWMLIATIFIAITLIFWEVAIAVQVYEARLEAPVENIDVKNFAILANSTEEYLFKKLTGRQSGWARTKSNPDLYDVLSDSSNEIDSGVAYELFFRYEMRINPEKCEKLRLYEVVPSALVENRSPPELSGAWFYSSKVPVLTRLAIDQSIAGLKESGRISKIVLDLTGSETADNCKLKPSRIPWVLLALLHAIISGIPWILLFIFMLIGTILRIRTRRCERIQPNYQDTPPTPQEKLPSSNVSEKSSESMKE